MTSWLRSTGPLPAPLRAPDLSALTIATLLGLGTLHVFRAPAATLAMLAIAAVCVWHGKVQALPLFAAFAAGFLSDLALNAWFRGPRATATRGRLLRQYFDHMGALLAALFAGGITVIMTIGTIALANYAGWSSPAGLVAAGFVVGAGIGVPGTQYSLALRELLPFYEHTSGMIENRTWDGASQAWAMVLVQLAVASGCSDPAKCEAPAPPCLASSRKRVDAAVAAAEKIAKARGLAWTTQAERTLSDFAHRATLDWTDPFEVMGSPRQAASLRLQGSDPQALEDTAYAYSTALLGLDTDSPCTGKFLDLYTSTMDGATLKTKAEMFVKRAKQQNPDELVVILVRGVHGGQEYYKRAAALKNFIHLSVTGLGTPFEASAQGVSVIFVGGDMPPETCAAQPETCAAQLDTDDYIVSRIMYHTKLCKA